MGFWRPDLKAVLPAFLCQGFERRNRRGRRQAKWVFWPPPARFPPGASALRTAGARTTSQIAMRQTFHGRAFRGGGEFVKPYIIHTGRGRKCARWSPGFSRYPANIPPKGGTPAARSTCQETDREPRGCGSRSCELHLAHRPCRSTLSSTPRSRSRALSPAQVKLPAFRRGGETVLARARA